MITKQRWITMFDLELTKRFGIGLEDTGMDRMEAFNRFAEEGEVPPYQAVGDFGSKYDLDPVR